MLEIDKDGHYSDYYDFIADDCHFALALIERQSYGIVSARQEYDFAIILLAPRAII